VRSPVAALAAIAGTFPQPSLDTAARLELVRLSLAACRGVERIVTDLAVASIRAEPVDAEVLVRAAVKAAALGGARVEITVVGALPAIDGDPTRIRQVLDNLIANAIVHGPQSGVVSVRAEAGEMLRISVSDSGDGIPPDQRERIFESGVRLSGDRPGSGLGLSLARAIAEGHGGALVLEPSADVGATFTLALPLPGS
jgi:signal transduction histidine kinase